MPSEALPDPLAFFEGKTAYPLALAYQNVIDGSNLDWLGSGLRPERAQGGETETGYPPSGRISLCPGIAGAKKTAYRAERDSIFLF